ncbi:MAG: exo-beta-N-acetylmuramidase NamZ family protein [Thermoanaerobaculia bacterium]
MISTGLDILLRAAEALRGRRFGLLAHAGAVSASCEPAHLALVGRGRAPEVLFGPEHGYYGVEQYMVPSPDERDPLTDLPVRSLYGEEEHSLRPSPDAFDGLDLLVIDLQDVGARYYTYAATGIWAAEVAIAAGYEVWVLDRPNPLGGVAVEGNMRRPGFESFVSAFELPVRHGLTLGELVRLEGSRRGWPADAVRVWPMEGWRRSMLWRDTGRPWVAPSPNLPTPEAALVFPGACLLEATELSEGRGTTRPFELLGAPGLDPTPLCARLRDLELPGVRVMPAYFRPQYWKHAGALCSGIQVVVTEPESFSPYRFGLELLAAVRALAPEVFSWRQEPYEFVSDRPAIDLLTGDSVFRQALDAGADWHGWVETWAPEEAAFRDERQSILLYKS